VSTKLPKGEPRKLRTAAICLAGAAVGLVPPVPAQSLYEATGRDLAVARYGVTGKGVAIAILDRGIEYQHPDFQSPLGTTRIKYLLDMSNQGITGTGTPPSYCTPSPNFTAEY